MPLRLAAVRRIFNDPFLCARYSANTLFILIDVHRIPVDPYSPLCVTASIPIARYTQMFHERGERYCESKFKAIVRCQPVVLN